MYSLLFWNKNIVNIDCIYKLKLLNSYNTPEINNVNVNIYLQTALNNSKMIIYPISVLTILTNQKPFISKSKGNVFLKNFFTNIKINLRKKQAYNFLSLLIFFIFPSIRKLQNLNIKKSTNCSKFSLSVNIKNIFSLPNLADYYSKFQKNTQVTVNIATNLRKQRYLNTFFTSFQIFLIRY